MNIVVCGAGEVGRHAADILGGAGHNITVIDLEPTKLSMLDETMDVRSMPGNAAHADVLRQSGVQRCDLFLAATNIDEINLLAASVAKAVGARKCIARIHHSAYLDHKAFDYREQFGIDHLVCPELTTASAISEKLRNPGALAIERFARGRIEMQQLPVSANARAVGKPLMEVRLPGPARLAAVERRGVVFVPDGATELHEGDIVTLVGDKESFDEWRKLFHTDKQRRKRIVVVGETAMGVWLCRALKGRDFSVRMFVNDRERSEELASKLDWVTVLRADPNEAGVLEDENLEQADAFVALTGDDEQNILTAARAKSIGVPLAISVLQQSTYLHLLKHVGIDQAFSPRVTALEEVQQLIEERKMHPLATLAEGIAEVWEIIVSDAAKITNQPLREIELPARTMIVAIERDDEVRVPGGEDFVLAQDRVVVVGPPDAEKQLRKLFAAW